MNKLIVRTGYALMTIAGLVVVLGAPGKFHRCK